MKIKKFLSSAKLNLRYLCSWPKYKRLKFNVDIMSIDHTLDFICEPGHSMVRFGDGEFMILDGYDIPGYHKFSNELQKRLQDTIERVNDPRLLVCLPEQLCGLSNYTARSRKHWTIRIAENYQSYLRYCKSNVKYGNTCVSRPYITYKDRTNSRRWISRLISIFEDRDIVVVEGKYSRSGVGNDLFGKARSVKRILCPSKDAYSRYTDIKEAILSHVSKDALVLLAIGPAAKPLVCDLVDHGYWVLDVGHIDSEYEWCLADAEVRVRKNNYKHVADMPDAHIEDCVDSAYLESIICDLSGSETVQ